MKNIRMRTSLETSSTKIPQSVVPTHKRFRQNWYRQKKNEYETQHEDINRTIDLRSSHRDTKHKNKKIDSRISDENINQNTKNNDKTESRSSSNNMGNNEEARRIHKKREK